MVRSSRRLLRLGTLSSRRRPENAIQSYEPDVRSALMLALAVIPSNSIVPNCRGIFPKMHKGRIARQNEAAGAADAAAWVLLAVLIYCAPLLPSRSAQQSCSDLWPKDRAPDPPGRPILRSRSSKRGSPRKPSQSGAWLIKTSSLTRAR
jgi:hypothetical protein